MVLFALLAMMFVGAAHADVPGRPVPAGAVPNPGTQQQELGNITFPAEWNVFEFVVTCGACHSGSVDQHAGHFGNWAGGNMASAARDPVFRANQIGVNNTVKAVIGQNGAGNMCMRCHSPNGWYSGRFDPALGGDPEGRTMMHSIVASTDDEGVMCETCHRAAGNVTYKRSDVTNLAGTGTLDSVWNVLAGVFDWPHQGHAPIDQAGDPVIAPGMPYGDTSLKYLEGMTYVGPYSGSADVYFSDLPLGGTYTGQIYAVYPDGWALAGNPMNPVPPGMPAQNSAGQYLAYNTDGTLPPALELPVGPPTRGVPVYQMQSISIEHPTVGSYNRKTSAWDMTANTMSPILPAGTGGSVSGNAFLRTSEFCGTCHELTVPVLNHGMPEQRTYTEWKFSDYSKSTNVGWDPIKQKQWKGEQRCQDCHMPKLKHEYSDIDTATYNPDPFLVGGFPYGKDRSLNDGVSFHKLVGANRDLPMMMKALYPEVDLEVIGAPTGRDPRGFPGMLTDRGPMWDRAKQNTDVSLRDALDVQITQAPTEVQGQSGVYEMKVRVTNNSGHRVPSGYPDGRRFWLSVAAQDPAGTNVYESGVYDQAQATLNTATGVAFNRALSNVVDATAGSNAVMVYERATGVCLDAGGAAIFPDPTAGVPAACIESTALTNNFILFDNRIPPKGFTYQDYRTAGIKFWNYDAATKVPHEDGGPAADKVPQRYPDGQNWDEVTYRFAAAPGQSLTASAEVYWQTHTREFMEHLRDSDASNVRPEGPPSILALNYPLTPTFLSDSINGKPLATIIDPFKNAPLNDNWGGVAYAAWLETGMGAPFLVDRDDSAVTAAPAAPTVTARALTPADPDYIDPVNLTPDPFAAKIEWTPVANADGYEIWILYGKPNPADPSKPTATADWDRLAVAGANATSHTEFVLSDASFASPGKTYGFKVVAFNGKGSTESNVFTHTVASGLPLAPTSLQASMAAPASTANSITLTWFDNADNEMGFEIWRFDALVNGAPFGQATIFPGTPGAGVATQTGGPVGGAPVTGLNTWVDTDPALQPNKCYAYQVRAVGAAGFASTFTVPMQLGCTIGNAPTLQASAVAVDAYNVNLGWTTDAVGVASYKISRNGVFRAITATPNLADNTVSPNTSYTYIVQAYDAANTLLAEGSATVKTPSASLAPTNVVASLMSPGRVTISWVDHETGEDGYIVERAVMENGVAGPFTGLVNGVTGPVAGSGGAGSLVDTTATQLVTYVYRVKATSKAKGDSDYATSNTVVAGVVAPTITAATSVADGNAAGPFATNATGGGVTTTLVWLDNAMNETGYEVQSCVGNDFSCGAMSINWKDANGAAGTTVLPADATTAAGHATAQTINTQVRYRVRAVAGTVASAWSVSVSSNVPAVPSKPGMGYPMVGMTDVAPGMPRISVSWFGGWGVTNYVLERSADAGATWTQVAAQTGTSFVDTAATGLAGGNTYQYRVTAINANGWSTSQASSATSLPAAPAALTITSVTPGGFGTMQRTTLAVKLSVPMLSYGSGWTVEYSPAGAGAWKVAATSSMSGNVTQNITGLNPGSAYDVRVRMYNQGGYSAWSLVVTGTTAP